MGKIGLYTQLADFTSAHAGTAEWCKAERDGKQFFVKKFHSPVYPTKDIGLPEKMYQAGVAEFKEAMAAKEHIYQRLRSCNQSGILVIPSEVINFEFHICTVAEFVTSNVTPEQICSLSEWQRLVLMRTLTLALMQVHQAGVVHSDMKPDNVLITQDESGHCKLRLIDFDGSFLESNPPTDPEEVVGDPTFFAPEAYQQSVEEDIRLDHRIDIFALGIIFHFFWCGKYPNKPADQTIGECLLLGGHVTMDESLPLVLKQLIQKMIAVRPEDRLTLKSVYDVLGIQVGRYPPTVINLQPPPRPVIKDPPPAEKKAEVRIECRTEAGEVLKYRTLKIPYGSSKTIEAEEIAGYHVAGLHTRVVEVDRKGYAASPVVFTYKKDQAGKSEPEEKKARHPFKTLLILAALFAVYWVVMFGMSMSAFNNGEWGQAKVYMDSTPLFSDLFEDIYQETVRMMNLRDVKVGSHQLTIPQGKTIRVRFVAPSSDTYIFTTTGTADTDGYLYSNEEDSQALTSDEDSGIDKNFGMEHHMTADSGVWVGVKYHSAAKKGQVTLKIQTGESCHEEAVLYYRDGEYKKARALFALLSSSDAKVYRDFCDAHRNAAVDYYQTLVDHMNLADAKEILLSDSNVAFQFLKGNWSVNGGGSSYTYRAYVNDDDGGQWMSNLPDSPGGGTWTIRNSCLYYTVDGNEMLLHRLVINNMNQITFYCQTTGTTYILTRDRIGG